MTIPVTQSAYDLGVVVDSQLTLSGHVAALCRSTYFQLRQIRPIARSLPLTTAKALIQAFLFCRLDYCNALLFGVSDTLVRRLQSVQNAAARFITGTRRRDHITPELHSLHWLPVRRTLATAIGRNQRSVVFSLKMQFMRTATYD